MRERAARSRGRRHRLQIAVNLLIGLLGTLAFTWHPQCTAPGTSHGSLS